MRRTKREAPPFRAREEFTLALDRVFNDYLPKVLSANMISETYAAPLRVFFKADEIVFFAFDE
ncbi:MAG: hypothetical protein EHM14_10375 [Methanothrix sp.]|nr:MAG: hypothetical protein EHM14_10375 [Methanothrix sp.]